MSTLTFDEMNLSPELMNGLRDVNYQEPTQIQESLIPLALEGKDILVKSEESEKGKYGSFIVPALEKLTKTEEEKGTQILVLTPHHDDAQKIDELFWAMGYHAQVDCATVGIEGDWDEQEKAISDGVQVLVANPGRLLEILQENRFVFRGLELLVLDRIEDLISLDLVSKLKDIKKRLISDYQVLGYADEFNDDVKSLVDDFMEEPEVVGFEKVRSNGQLTTEPPELSSQLKQGYIKVPNRMKITTLMAHIDSTPTDKCAIFTASKRGTDRLYRVLRKRNYSATSLHGKLSDDKRSQRFSNFANGDVQFLLVADISAADLQLDKVEQVINYDVPNDPDEYRYRAGLVGEGKAGRIVSLVSKQDRSDINQLKNELGEAPSELPLPDEVKKKLEERRKKNKSKNKNRSKSRGRSKSKQKRGSRGNKRQKSDDMELPKPSYDKLSGGRTGNNDEEKGVLDFFKKLFTS
ncbi:DEAD/DEAH box helicase [Aliifodinibius sp. S!AR15-10]|uniref:DEAD/DEAH box helicase n=1 Tax=Aliifodinibius sp. S!AR15-10 TaxID=2950437 RepID=UPI0028635350|nr:DEAD/DEAH box helicase [Aliifodinibius sp. S!AR15-10]MDR8394338.1 DEAD/DEAH box helicase [Aliifodinibius sp. S!AR15-10]